uniref:Transcriptional regulator, BadM/Rrf2 family n=1 Tax=Cereibacter sphaeroides (strain ATCC 17025 / ATH 2.4.3) TaxID=349102 RepID=A4WQN8_CERS5
MQSFATGPSNFLVAPRPSPWLSAMITQKMKYALKALMVLAEEHSGEQRALRIEDIAARSETPKRFLEHILLDIRNAGYIASIRGRSGGYLLIKEPAQIPLSDLLRMIDGPIAPLPCLSRRSYQRCDDCTDETSCRIRKVFAEIFWSYLLLIESLTLADLVRTPAASEQILAAPTLGAAQKQEPGQTGRA